MRNRIAYIALLGLVAIAAFAVSLSWIHWPAEPPSSAEPRADRRTSTPSVTSFFVGQHRPREAPLPPALKSLQSPAPPTSQALQSSADAAGKAAQAAAETAGRQ
jgi:hypothetical protein